MLRVCAAMMLSSLAYETPLRGAICIGPATELDKNDLYGPAIMIAYDLEKNIAGYPRIVISQRAMEFLQKTSEFDGNPRAENIMRMIILGCKDLIRTDHDGMATVDFVSRFSRTLCEEKGISSKELLEKALRFVRNSKKEFATKHDHKHFTRYTMLERYMNEGLASWAKDLSSEQPDNK